jgi:hypothetical protein
VLEASQLNAITELPSSTKSANYTLVAGDAGERVIANGTSITFTVPNSVFSAGQVVELLNINSTALTVAAGAGATVNAAAGLTLSQYQSAQLYAVSASSFVLAKTDVTASAGALTLVSSTAIGSAVSSVTVSSAFSSTYDNYRVNIIGGTFSTNTTALLTFGSTSTGYYFAAPGLTYSASVNNGNGNNTTQFSFVLAGDTNSFGGYFDCFGPNLATNTRVAYTRIDNISDAVIRVAGGILANTTQYTAFTLTMSSGTMTGGTIRVYGYANS